MSDLPCALPPPRAADARAAFADRVIATLLEEHVTLRCVLQVLERTLREIAELGVEPDFHLLCSALYYIDQFPERVHHPKEDLHLFARLRADTARFDRVLERLEHDHACMPQSIALIERELVHYQGGAAWGLERLRAALSAYARMLDEHMRTEEALFEDARGVLPEDAWRAIGEAFGTDRDPLAQPSGRDEFQRLRERIAKALPRRIRRATATAAAMGRDDA